MTMANAALLKSEYDIVFAGGGTTACLVAGRLAKADPSLKLLVLEAGPHTNGKLEHIQPGRYLSHMRPGSITTQTHIAKPSDSVAGRSIAVHCGSCVGGGSSVNLAMYNRASASDYDDWETKYNNPGWGSSFLIPLLQKAENYQVDPSDQNLSTHGYSGPLNVSLGGDFSLPAQQFLEIGSRIEQDRPISNDNNTLHPDSVNVFARIPKWIDGSSGKRSDTPHYFVYNQTDNKNLEVVDGCRVTRVIFEYV
ncbi:hypothetical protein HGRIS_004809 [Hohenbuehelia grisea]|uniref:Glucose-methanol-choline oxidoreductase N-terminal domain-containing protein n=1 Tax=Hohenbuehelia grisea TaxID=104357 RepID=A0ABR3JDI1_9AGAR